MDQFTDVYFFMDDSGVLDFAANEKYFLYCGYMIIGKENKDNYCANIIQLEMQLRKNIQMKKKLREKYSIKILGVNYVTNFVYTKL